MNFWEKEKQWCKDRATQHFRNYLVPLMHAIGGNLRAGD